MSDLSSISERIAILNDHLLEIENWLMDQTDSLDEIDKDLKRIAEALEKVIAA
jgi:hypothetical protein